MKFSELSKLGSLFSKGFAEDFFRLLVIYNDISASEAASRLDQHIKTAQDFLEGLAELGIVEKSQVFEKKRPYYRYRLITHKIQFSFDLNELYNPSDVSFRLTQKIREKKNAGAMFSTAGNNERISQVVVLTGEGRKRKERKINLTIPQGRFLFHLPFPNAKFKTVSDIIDEAAIDNVHVLEIIDVVGFLVKFGIIEIK